MCGCSINLGQVLESVENRQEICQKLKLDKAKFMAGDLYEISKFAYIVNPQGFKDKLATVGLSFNDAKLEEELLALTELHKTGNDLNGLLVDKNGNKIIFDYLSLIQTLPLKRETIDKTKFCFI